MYYSCAHCDCLSSMTKYMRFKQNYLSDRTEVDISRRLERYKEMYLYSMDVFTTILKKNISTFKPATG